MADQRGLRPYYRGFTVQNSSLGTHWCPYYRGFTVQDSSLGTQWCPYYRGITVQSVHCGPSGVLTIEVSQYRTVYCGPIGVLTIEVSQYQKAYCAPNGVLIVEVSQAKYVHTYLHTHVLYTCTYIQMYIRTYIHTVHKYACMYIHTSNTSLLSLECIQPKRLLRTYVRTFERQCMYQMSAPQCFKQGSSVTRTYILMYIVSGKSILLRTCGNIGRAFDRELMHRLKQ